MSNTVTVSARAFYDALQSAAAERKSNIPILTCVLVQAFGPVIRVIGTDLEKTTFTEIPAVTDGTVPEFMVPCRKAMDLLKGETGELVITPGEDNWLKLSVPGCDYDLVSMAPVNFPEPPEIPEAQFTVSGDAFKTLLARTSFAIATEQSRYTLNGALFEVARQTLKIVATDGHRIALDSLEVEGAPDGKAIIPLPVLEWIKGRLAKTNVHIALGQVSSCFIIDHLHTTIVFRNLAGQFPCYEAVMPRRDAAKTTVAFASSALSKSLVKVAQCADERSGAVRFSANGAFKIAATSTETGAASATIPAVIEGEDVSVGFSARYILDFLKAAGSTPIRMSLNTAQNAGLLDCPELPGYSYVLMPMRM